MRAIAPKGKDTAHFRATASGTKKVNLGMTNKRGGIRF